MLYLFKVLFFLIDITQETVLNWFGLEHPMIRENREVQELYSDKLNVDLNTDFSTIEMSPAFSIDTLRLITQGLWENLQDGLALADIDNIIVCVIIIRFIILAIRYNLTTAFLISSIGVIAAYLWYRHFIQMLFLYESALYKIPFTYKLGVDSYQIRSTLIAKIRHSDYQIRLSNPVGILMYAIGNGSVQNLHRIDPLSMLVAKLPQEFREEYVERIYYLVYRKLIPLTIKFATQFYREISSFAAYTLMVRIGKKFCPYLIRWHWTFMVMTTFIEPYFIGLIFRINYYVTSVLTPQVEKYRFYKHPEIVQEIQFLNFVMIAIILGHLAFLLFALFHALCGQYFYLPLLTENVELHIGPRDKNSIYSGGYTSWQDPEEKEKNLSRRGIPKLWYGWFGRGTKGGWNILKLIQVPIKWIFKKVLKFLKRSS
jgi:hypothetical protein